MDAIQKGGIRLDRIYLAADVVVGANGQPVCNVTKVTNGALYPDCVPINLFGRGQGVARGGRLGHGLRAGRADTRRRLPVGDRVACPTTTSAARTSAESSTSTRTSGKCPPTASSPTVGRARSRWPRASARAGNRSPRWSKWARAATSTPTRGTGRSWPTTRLREFAACPAATRRPATAWKSSSPTSRSLAAHRASTKRSLNSSCRSCPGKRSSSR